MTPEQFANAAVTASPKRFAMFERLYESWATPQQFHAAAGALSALGRPDLAELLSRSKTWSYLDRAGALPRFTREDLSEDVTFYRQDLQQIDADQRRLLIGVTARGGRLTLPVSAFLQALPENAWDVLILRDRWRVHYRQGCAGFAHDFQELARKVSALACSYDYTITLGTSMGGLPAIRLALMANLGRAISIGGRQWDDVARIGEPGRHLPAYDPLCACRSLDQSEHWFVSAAGHSTDLKAAEQYAALWGGRAIALPDLHSHHVLGEAWLTGQLPQVLQFLLDEPAAPNN